MLDTNTLSITASKSPPILSTFPATPCGSHEPKVENLQYGVRCSSVYIVYFWLYRDGACALCSRGESLSYSGAGLPYDSAEHDPSRSH